MQKLSRHINNNTSYVILVYFVNKTHSIFLLITPIVQNILNLLIIFTMIDTFSINKFRIIIICIYRLNLLCALNNKCCSISLKILKCIMIFF